jgi:hypothetical protein
MRPTTSESITLTAPMMMNTSGVIQVTHSEGADMADWGEREYVDYLHGQRRRFAWVMQRYGGFTAAEAEAAALEQYPYEASDAPYRWLVFHDRAWHWAMLRTYQDLYWVEHPELAQPSAEYRALG